MNGAQALIRTLARCGVDVCFSNPGTSEMHFVEGRDEVHLRGSRVAEAHVHAAASQRPDQSLRAVHAFPPAGE